MSKISISYPYAHSVASIRFDDGKGNILDSLMMEELQAVLDSLEGNTDLKLIVFEGGGKHFSFGASVEEHRKEFAGAMLKTFHRLIYSLRDLSVPMLAKVSGQCLGGGLELALMCNFIFADKSAKFAQPEIILGVFPPPASILLPEKIGYARAEELLLTGVSLNADTAKSIGLVNALFDDKSSLDEGVQLWIEKNILPKSASSLRYSFKATRIKLNYILTNFLPQLESLYLNQLMETYDANEGIEAFIEKRNPVWRNC